MYVGRLRKYNLYLLWLQVNGSEASVSPSSKLGCLISIAHSARRESEFYCVWQWWEKKGKRPSTLQTFLLFLQKLPPSNILRHSPSAVDSPFSALAKGLLGSLFICFLPCLPHSLLPTSAVLGTAAPVSIPRSLPWPSSPSWKSRCVDISCVSPRRLKTAYRWKYSSCHCILYAQGKSWWVLNRGFL